MAVPEGEKPTPNPEAAKPGAQGAASATGQAVALREETHDTSPQGGHSFFVHQREAAPEQGHAGGGG